MEVFCMRIFVLKNVLSSSSTPFLVSLTSGDSACTASVKTVAAVLLLSLGFAREVKAGFIV